MPTSLQSNEQKRTAGGHFSVGAVATLLSGHANESLTATGDISVAGQQATKRQWVSPKPSRTIHHAPPNRNARSKSLTEKVWFVDELPKGATGKILKREIVPPSPDAEASAKAGS
jgi:acyl-CoA synthetase (AMP-forming)/AMP-acid ligase II